MSTFKRTAAAVLLTVVALTGATAPVATTGPVAGPRICC